MRGRLLLLYLAAFHGVNAISPDLLAGVPSKKAVYQGGTLPGTQVPLTGSVDLTGLLKEAPVGQWRTLKVRLSCLRDAGADVAAVDQPFGLKATGPVTIAFEAVRLASNEGDAVCPKG